MQKIASQANRRPNVTYALVIVVIDERMTWVLRSIENLGRTEARHTCRLKVPFETLEKHEIESLTTALQNKVFDTTLAVDRDV